MQRQPQRVLQPLPLPLRQYLELDQLPAPTYKVPSLVSLPGPADDGFKAGLVAAHEWLHSRIAYQLQQLASANVSTKMLALWLLALPFIMLAAAVYQQAATVSFKEAMYKVRHLGVFSTMAVATARARTHGRCTPDTCMLNVSP